MRSIFVSLRILAVVAGFLIVGGSGSRLCASEAARPEMKRSVFVVTNGAYGAVPDGVTDNTRAIQAAINAAGAAGGGVVQLPAADKAYASGALKLASGVQLQIDHGATLAMLPYKTYTGTADFITLDNLHDVKISGGGIIEGLGAPWWKAFDDEKIRRPKAMIAVVKSERVVIEGITTHNPPNTHIQLRGSAQVAIIGITILSPERSHNTDGIDVSGRNILIDRCKIACGDDNIAIGGSSVANADITITNCDFGYGHGLSIGSYTSGGLRNLKVDHCTFVGTMAGIRMKTGRDRGGVVENLSYSNITMTDVEKPIYITSYYPNSTMPKDPAADAGAPVTTKTPIWRNILIQNLTSRAAMDNKRCSAGIVWGVPEMPAGELVLDNVSVTAPEGMLFCNALVNFRGNVRFDAGANEPAASFYNVLVIASQPRSQRAAVGADAVFEVTLQGGKGSGKEPPQVSWSRDGAVLTDGRQVDGTEIVGARTTRLALRRVAPGSAGRYVATVSETLLGMSAKVSLQSDAAELQVAAD